MVAKPKQEKTNKPKPPIVTSEARGNLNPTESAKDSKSVIKAWCVQEGHQRGYGVAPIYWKHIFRALSLMQKRGNYPEPHELARSIEELLRPFEYDEEVWAILGEIRFLDNDDERKMGVYIAVNPYISPEKGVLSTLETTSHDEE